MKRRDLVSVQEVRRVSGASRDHAGSCRDFDAGLVGSGLIAAAILLSTLITAVGTRFIGMDSPNDDNMWLIDRLTGNVYKCQAAQPGKASCDTETVTGSIGEPRKR